MIHFDVTAAVGCPTCGSPPRIPCQRGIAKLLGRAGRRHPHRARVEAASDFDRLLNHPSAYLAETTRPPYVPLTDLGLNNPAYRIAEHRGDLTYLGDAS